MNTINFDKHIWEGWRVRDFIDELEPRIEAIISYDSWTKPFNNRKELADWCKDNQPYYGEEIPEVVNYFAEKYNIK